MDGLDVLKQHWGKEQNFPKINKEEIRRMLRKSSASIVKWIFIISLIEITLGAGLRYAIPPAAQGPSTLYTIVGVVYETIFYSVILYFIYHFFDSYRQIKNINSTKVLLGTILRTRRYVGYYIRFNIYCIIFSLIFIFLEKLVGFYQTKSIGSFVFALVLGTILMSFFSWLFLLIVKLYYKVLYHRLVVKLNENYEELLRIETSESN